ncbi:hypothetical protein ATO11_11105 [Pseudaestuariivita atlantica]|uniref:VWFA domain-containing protein n=2 Tax=Pseudaestuariivita atlantica TaxID=1317121 RepID=A0A0L1JR93_9RHOB|nr:hypothetical protein ATO11_11105 [Pseudaestuariivita atlantica]
MRPGPVYDAAMQAVADTFPKTTRWTPSMPAAALTGGIDPVATLAAGRAVHRRGLLQQEAPLIVASAERLEPQTAAIIAQAMDDGGAPPLILIDESAEAEESPPLFLTDRVAFLCDLTGLSMREIGETTPDSPATAVVEDPEATLALIAARLGIPGVRPVLLALGAARALADGDEVTEADVAQAAALVLAPRALTLPEEMDEDSPAEETPKQEECANDGDTGGSRPLDDMVIDAVRARLPDGLLDTPPTLGKAGRGFSGSGAKRRGNRRGRPLPAKAGAPDGHARLDLVATLRAAIPWQTLRHRAAPDRTGVILRPSDLHVQRMEERADRVLVFTVDASGSSAMARLGEVKGAIELVLARAYARRDHVALVAFRKEQADTILPPTRSLVQAKRQLAALPGGGGTPLATGMEAGLRQALHARSRGMTPQMILLTDGRGNIAIDGTANRTKASEDAQQVARHLAASRIDTLVIDTGARPQAPLAELARNMHATYVPLPRAQASQISDVVADAL